jgi:NTP pyrophosphatase (non-canonical NTP hydrolase)
VTLKELAAAQYTLNWLWFPEKAEDLRHHVLGLVGEAGEVANLVKKWDRGDFQLDDTYPTGNPEHRQETMREVIGEEVIDVIIYALSLCYILGIDPDKVLEEKVRFNGMRFGRLPDDA